MQLIQQINNINLEAEESFWLKLAELGEKRSFKKQSTFGGLCEACKICIIPKNICHFIIFKYLCI